MPKNINLAIFLVFILQAANEIVAIGNAEAGKTTAAQCASCHGSNGNSIAPLFPRLAGQHAGYIVEQLAAFKNGERHNETMQAMSGSLSDQDIENISAFYSQQERILSDGEQYVDEDEETPVTEDLIDAGRKLYRGGNSNTGISACIACHGPEGLGNESAGFPVVNGQYAVYVGKALNDFKSGERKDKASMMTLITEKMTTNEINAVSAFISSMH